ncbi:FadR/GntR family transcriptional regulator [Vallitalea guaymasensis]|uniref:FadR/GntR family transcriptional regulator n=1 Tax=Vallitalea guaymasensis TaxID=1185412 RepID=UPI00235800EF|nr:FadR/GntR family transcriptional regulator [Vallitalea guaymasensis]
MINIFSPVKNKKIYEYVIEQIQKMILEGTLKEGDRLPAERELTDLLGVSRTSVREAIRALEVIGLVESRQGEGNFISSNVSNTLLEPLSVKFMLSKGNTEEILELRRLLELETASLAARKATEKDIEELQILINKLRTTDDENLCAKIDKEFHYKISEIAANSLIMNILLSVQYLMEASIIDAREMILKNPEQKDLLIKQHEDIYDSIKSHNPEEAQNAMREHLAFVNKTPKNS